ncbi:AI-2E family transporter [uncultured Fretibacterium sp.]|uniref:AI-2E family transporter n=1 Tax=uncultured Fretibacterium sp. TaxID=1678694 RepID=UPI0026121A77|nr:AI-2E family transporter [uncultured Fretibacterium sp.]
MNMKVLVGLVALLSAIALCTILNLASGVFIPLVVAWFILQVFRPVIRLGWKIHLPPILNITLVFAIFFSVCVLGIYFCTLQAVEFNRAYNLYYSKLNTMFNGILKALNIPPSTISNFNWLDLLGRYVRNISELVLAFSSKFVLTLVFFMFMLLEAPYVNEKIDKSFSGASAFRIKNILDTISRQISRYLGTLSLISLATAFSVWMVLVALGVELASGWGVLTFLLNFIPTVGSIIATIPPVLMAVLQFSPSLFKPLVVLISLTAIQITIGNVITPKVVGDRLGLSPVVILLSLLLWGTIWGIPGALLSVPIASIIKIVCENIQPLRPIAVLMGSGEAALLAAPPASREKKKHSAVPEVPAEDTGTTK